MALSQIFSTLQTEIHTVSQHHCTEKWCDNGFPVRDPFARIYYVLKGEGEVVHHNRRFRLIPGHLYLIPGFCSFRYKCDELMDQYFIHMTIKAFGGVDAPGYFDWSFESKITEAKRIRDIWRELHKLWKKQNPRNSLAADGLARQLLSEFVPVKPRESEEEKVRILSRFIPVMNYIENHFSEKITLQLLASLIHLQPNYFSNLFTCCFGIPPMKYLQQIRIQRAQSMLLKRDAKFAQIADETGFCDVFHFSKNFKKITGISPIKFQNMAMNR